MTDNQSEEFKIPEVSFESISNDGLVVFSFSDKFVKLDDLSQLKKQEIFYKGEKKDNIELFVDTVDDQTTEQVAISWEVVSFSETEMTLQITFTEPKLIS